MAAVEIDERELSARAATVVADAVPGSELGPVERLQGGQSSVTYAATYRDPASSLDRVVLKVAPAGLAPTKNRDVLRQARLQRALQGTGVPCPRVLAEHPGAPPEIPPFYVMAFEDGACIEPNFLPPGEQLAPDDVTARELEAARILGLLHSLDPPALGLGDEPEVTPHDELARWSDSFDACEEDLRDGHEEVRDRLAAAVPAPASSTLIHGDYRLGNTMSTVGRVVSVIDWEIWARSDPRVDLAWFQMMCNPDPVLDRPTCAGMPPDADLLDRYQQARGVEVDGMAWFHALVRYKQGAIMALLVRNARRRGREDPMGSPRGLLDSATKLLAVG